MNWNKFKSVHKGMILQNRINGQVYYIIECKNRFLLIDLKNAVTYSDHLGNCDWSMIELLFLLNFYQWDLLAPKVQFEIQKIFNNEQ